MAYIPTEIARYELLQPALLELSQNYSLKDSTFGHGQIVEFRHQKIETRWNSFLTHPVAHTHWKEEVLSRIKAHVDEVIPSFCATTSTRDDLIKYWDHEFSPLHYFIIFDYMKDLIDYEKSKPIGQYFMKSLYVTLAVKVTQLRLTERCGKKDRLAAALHTELSLVYDKFPSHKNFEGLTRKDFFETSSDEQRELELKEAEKLVEDSYCFASGDVPANT